MLVVWFFVYKKLAQFAVGCALPPRRSESPGCTADNKPSCVLHLLGSFIGSRGFSSLEQRPEFWVLQFLLIVLVQSFRQSCSTLCDPKTAAHQTSLSFTISRNLLKLTSIEPISSNRSHPLSSPSPPTFSLSRHQGLFQLVGSSHQVAKLLELQLQHQSFQ